MTTRAQQTERAEAIERLREWIAPGDTIYTILRHRSASGMQRVIQLIALDAADHCRPLHIGYSAALAMGERYDRDREGIVIRGAGMDVGFALVYDLARTLWPDGAECIGERCLSNDHSNGDRDYTPHLHNDGGYTLRHSWI